jgi:pimeloyl-ACP methyl ester carboxylesterase
MTAWRLGAIIATALATATAVCAMLQPPPVRTPDPAALRELAGAYQWTDGGFLYLQPWAELSGTRELVAIDEGGEVRTLYPLDGTDRFFAGPGAAVSTSIESRIEVRRDAARAVAGLTWQREGQAPRTARRVPVERREDVRFSNGAVSLAGTLTSPTGGGRHATVVLVHGSGAATREQVFPLARFLVRHGVAVLAYDKRGVGESTGDWTNASFDDLAGDAIAAVDYLKARGDVDPAKIGLFGWSQAGWVMPLAAIRQREIAFLISLSGPGVPASETTLDQAANEMTARGMKPQVVEQIVALMKRQYEFARTGQGWDEYVAARQALAARIGTPPPTFPGTRDDPHWGVIRRLYLHDSGPVLRRLRTPTLALFGERDNNILAEKNRAAWERELKAAGHPDYTLRILSNANHGYLEAKTGSNLEIPSLDRFVPDYRTTILDWLAARLKISPSPPSR